MTYLPACLLRGWLVVHDLYPSATEIMLHAGRGRLLAFISASLSRLKRPAVVARIFITFSVVAGQSISQSATGTRSARAAAGRPGDDGWWVHVWVVRQG